jgi:hypothetical protein
MLLSGIIEQLLPATSLDDPKSETFHSETLLSFFFCQASVPKLSNARDVLRGLIYMIIKQEPSLLPHVRDKFKQTGEPRFGDAEAWVALCNILLGILRDPIIKETYLIVDALDECVQGQDKLLNFVLHEAKLPRVKWLISSRHNIEHRIRLEPSQSIIILEDNKNMEYISQAINTYIISKTSQVESLQDDSLLQDYVRQVLQDKAEGTFLWVALVIQELEKVDSWRVRQVVDNAPQGLDDLYARMIDQMEQLGSTDTEYCRLVLSAATLAYRPLQLDELGAVSGLPDMISNNIKNIRKIVAKSGSFLTVREETVEFVHKSAKDYLVGKMVSQAFLSDSAAAHRHIVRNSLQIMTRILRRNMYDLRDPGTSIHQVQQPNPDPLAAAGYSCVYWVDHLEESAKTTIYEPFKELQDDGPVNMFLRDRYLYWLEALSLLRGVAKGVMSIQKLESMLEVHLNI